MSQDDLANYHVVVVTEILNNIDEVTAFNKYCHDHGKGFILSQNLGAYGYVFLDYGEKFQVNDADGEETKAFIVTSVTKHEDHLVVTVHEDKRHKFQDGDHVNFREVQGMDELNKLPPTKITVIDGFSFKVHVDGNNFQEYLREGLVENVKVPQTIKFHDL